MAKINWTIQPLIKIEDNIPLHYGNIIIKNGVEEVIMFDEPKILKSKMV